MNGFEVAIIVLVAMAIIAIAALVVVNLKLAARIQLATENYAALEQKFTTLREQNQQELLAIGQRVLEADKLVRRFSERLDAIENNHTTEQAQYGQLQNLLKQTSALEGETSSAEKELLSLLTRNRKLTS